MLSSQASGTTKYFSYTVMTIKYTINTGSVTTIIIMIIKSRVVRVARENRRNIINNALPGVHILR